MTKRFILNKIKVCNFYNYYGENVIDLTTSSDKNLFLFNISNGGGKTSLFHAIKWSFYGEKCTYMKNGVAKTAIDFMNIDADPDEGFYTEVSFTYDDEPYVLRRSCTNPKSNKSTLMLNKAGIEYHEPHSIDMLEHIIPSNYGNFFMFDGDELAQLANAQNDTKMVEGVLQLLGLKEINDLKDSLEKLAKKLKTDRDNELSKEQKNTKDSVDLQKLKLAEIECNDVINSLKKNIADLDVTIRDLREQRGQFKDISNQLERQREESRKKNKYELENDKIRESIKDNACDLFKVFIHSNLQQFIEEDQSRIEYLELMSDVKTDDAQSMEQRLLIIKNHLNVCPVCSSNLTADDIDCIESLIKSEQEKHERYKQYADEISALKSEMNLFASFSPTSFDYQYNISQYHDNEIQIKQCETIIEGIEKGMITSGYEVIEQLSTEIEDNIERKKGFEDRLSQEQIKSGMFKRQISDITTRMMSATNSNQMSVKYNAQYVHVNSLIKALDEVITHGTKLKRDSILNTANEIFLSMTNKASIFDHLEYINDSSYSFQTIRKDGKVAVNPSNGELQVRAMSFLIALTKCTERSTPIMMDTPLSRLDEVHATNIGDALAKLDNQIIFLAQPAELAVSSVKDNLTKSAAKIFTSDISDDNCAHIREVDSI